KQEFMLSMLEQLTDAERNEVIPQHLGHVQPDQWLAFALKHPQFFQNQPMTRSMNFLGSPRDLETCKKAAAIVQGNPTWSGAIFNSLALGPDFETAATHYLKEETWYLNPHEAMDNLRNIIWGWSANNAQAAGKPLPGDLFDKTLVKFGPEYIV